MNKNSTKRIKRKKTLSSPSRLACENCCLVSMTSTNSHVITTVMAVDKNVLYKVECVFDCHRSVQEILDFTRI